LIEKYDFVAQTFFNSVGLPNEKGEIQYNFDQQKMPK